MPAKGPSSFSSMPQIDISTPGVKMLLDNLKPHKASGPNSIPPMVLMELSNEIAPLANHSFFPFFTTWSVVQLKQTCLLWI